MTERKVRFNLDAILAEPCPDREGRASLRTEFDLVTQLGAAWKKHNPDRKPFLTKEDIDRINDDRRLKIKK